MDAVVWQGSGTAWPGMPWGRAVERRLTRLGWRVTCVPWEDTGAPHRGRPDVLHVFSGGLEPVASGSPEMAARLDAVAAALATAERDDCSVVGICLGAQMIAAVTAGLLPRAVPGGGEAGLTTLRGHGPGAPDLVVATAHVAEVPPEFLARPGVRHLWSNPVTTVQGFAVGRRVVGVQFHPEFSAHEGRRAAHGFRRALGAPPASAPPRGVDPRSTMGVVLRLAGTAGPAPATTRLDGAGAGGNDVTPGGSAVLATV